MSDTCTITKPGAGPPVLDPTTLAYTDPTPVVVYSGICQFGLAAARGITNTLAAAAGEASWKLEDSEVKLPALASGDVRTGHIATCTSSADDAALVGRQFGVISAPTANQKTARRCRIREVVAD